MKMIHQKSVARVEVQKSFCKRCQLAIKAELQKIEKYSQRESISRAYHGSFQLL